jgi:hypothetical protein
MPSRTHTTATHLDCSIACVHHCMRGKVCSAACRAAGFRLAGVEASYGCFCGNTNASTIVPAATADCCSPCTGNTSESCGNKFRVWVYETDGSTTSTPPVCGGGGGGGAVVDPRDIRNGTVMLTAGYLDQPYCDKLSSGRWVCSITYDDKGEGGSGEHIVAFWSDDKGTTWSKPVTVEPAPINTELANAYSMTIVAPGRGASGADRTYVPTTTTASTTHLLAHPTTRHHHVTHHSLRVVRHSHMHHSQRYVIYNMNVQNVTRFPSGAPLGRSDMLGDFVMRYSDDGGATWSNQRYIVPNPLRLLMPCTPSCLQRFAIVMRASLISPLVFPPITVLPFIETIAFQWITTVTLKQIFTLTYIHCYTSRSHPPPTRLGPLTVATSGVGT